MKIAAICSVDDCGKPLHRDSANYCAMHRTRMWRHAKLELPIFQPKVKMCRGCNKEFADRDKNGRSIFCETCKQTKWKFYPRSRWETSEIGKAYYKKYNAEYKAQLRKIVFDYYGPQCNCCNESGAAFLSIDHVNNDGHLDRKAGVSGIRLYQKIINSNFSEDYQILCMNCNFAKKNNGGVCPHQT